MDMNKHFTDLWYLVILVAYMILRVCGHLDMCFVLDSVNSLKCQDRRLCSYSFHVGRVFKSIWAEICVVFHGVIPHTCYWEKNTYPGTWAIQDTKTRGNYIVKGVLQGWKGMGKWLNATRCVSNQKVGGSTQFRSACLNNSLTVFHYQQCHRQVHQRVCHVLSCLCDNACKIPSYLS